MFIFRTKPKVRTEKREELAKKERERQEEWDKKTEGKEAPADKGKKLRRGRIIIIIFRKERTKAFIDAGFIV